MPSKAGRAHWRALARLLRVRCSNGIARGGDCRALLTIEEFEQERRRQQAYADRACSRFVFLRFVLSGANRTARETAREQERALCTLAEVVRDRSRLSDIPGWCLDDGHTTPGLILRNTGPEGAERVVRSIVSSFEQRYRLRASTEGHPPEVLCKTFPYPDHSTLRGECPVESDVAAAHRHRDLRADTDIEPR